MIQLKRFAVVLRDGVCRQVKRNEHIRIPIKLHLETVCDVFVQAPEDMDAPINDEAASSKEAACSVGERRSRVAAEAADDSASVRHGPSCNVTKRRVVR